MLNIAWQGISDLASEIEMICDFHSVTPMLGLSTLAILPLRGKWPPVQFQNRLLFFGIMDIPKKSRIPKKIVTYPTLKIKNSAWIVLGD